LSAYRPSTDKYAEELRLSREILKAEMQKAIRAISPSEKRDLLALWREHYSPSLAAELLRVAKNPEARVRIANWNLTEFDQHRRKSR
jgi:hypothetical protein